MNESPFRAANREQGRDRLLDARVRNLEQAMASQIPIDPIPGLTATTVQEALEEMAAALVVAGVL